MGIVSSKVAYFGAFCNLGWRKFIFSAIPVPFFYWAVLKPVANHVATRHFLAASSDGAYGDIFSRLGQVNSYHQYGFTEISSTYTVLASAPDGVIEAMIHSDLPMMGIMWHPEREREPSPVDLQLFRQVFGVNAP